MKNLVKILSFALIAAVGVFLVPKISSAQESVNGLRVTQLNQNGNKVFLELDLRLLEAQLDTLFNATSAASSAASSSSWSDVLSNGSNPGMDINFNNYDITGLGELTSSGTLTADSLILNKDATITGRVDVTDVAEFGDSLKVTGFVEFADSLRIVKAVTIGETLYVTGVTTLGDSLHVAGNVDFDALFNVDGAATFGSSLTVAGATTLNDTLQVNSGAGIAGTLYADSLNVTDVINGQIGSLANHSTTNLTEGSNLYFTDARARGAISAGTGVTLSTGEISIGQAVGTTDDVTFNELFADSISATGTLTVSGKTTLNDSLHVSSGAEITGALYADSVAANGLSVAGAVRIADGTEGAGKVLTSNANGYATWQNASAGGATYTAGTGVDLTNDVISIGQAVGTTDDVTFNELFADSVSTASLFVDSIGVNNGGELVLSANSGTWSVGDLTLSTTTSTWSAGNQLTVQAGNPDGQSTSLTMDDTQLSITGTTSLSDSLHVAGHVTLGDQLTVSGETTLNDSLHVNSGAAIDGAFNVSGITTLNDSLYVNSSVEISGDFNIGGELRSYGLRADSSIAQGGAASNYFTTALGSSSTASGVGAIAAGYSTSATGTQSIAIGTLSNASGINAVAIGESAQASATQGVAVGKSAQVSSDYANVAVGVNSQVTSGWGNTAIGGGKVNGSTGAPTYNVAIGPSTISSAGAFNVALGANSTISGNGSTAYSMTFGPFASVAGGFRNMAFGASAAINSGNSNYAMGDYASVNGNAWHAYALGDHSKVQANGHHALAFGPYSEVSAFNAANFAFESPARFSHQAIFGSYADTTAMVPGGSSHDDWIRTDPLFVVANGATETSRSNALVIRKDGAAMFSDSMHVAGHVTLGDQLTVSGETTLNDSLHVNSGVQIADGTEGSGKVLTSDANGYATWQPLPAAIPFNTYEAWIDHPSIVSGVTASTTSAQMFVDSASIYNADPESNFSLSAGGVSVSTTGYYDIEGYIFGTRTTFGSGYITGIVTVNSSAALPQCTATDEWTLNVNSSVRTNCRMLLNSGDVVKLNVIEQSGGTSTITNAGIRIEKVGTYNVP